MAPPALARDEVHLQIEVAAGGFVRGVRYDAHFVEASLDQVAPTAIGCPLVTNDTKAEGKGIQPLLGFKAKTVSKVLASPSQNFAVSGFGVVFV